MMLETKRIKGGASKRKQEKMITHRAVINECLKLSDSGFKSTAITEADGADKRLNSKDLFSYLPQTVRSEED